MPNSLTKRQYNLTYLANRSGIKTDGRTRLIIIYFNEIKKLIHNPSAMALINEYDFSITENRQTKLFNPDATTNFVCASNAFKAFTKACDTLATAGKKGYDIGSKLRLELLKQETPEI
jgi:hypothetical protein